MEKIKAKATAQLEFTIKLVLTPGEASALDAIVGYGTDPFLKVFYEHMGKAYLQPHEKEMKNLFETIKTSLSPELYKIKKAREAINAALTEINA